MSEGVELKACPKCGEIPKMGYACGEYFIMSTSNTSKLCLCDKYAEMHSNEELEAERWNGLCDVVFPYFKEYEENIAMLQKSLENAHDEATKDFCHFLIDRSEGGVISICDLPELLVEWGALPEVEGYTAKADNSRDAKRRRRGRRDGESDAAALMRILRTLKTWLKRSREIPYIQRPTAWALYHAWREEDCRK